MSGDSLAHKLEWFKQNEKPEVVLVVADSPELIKIVIAWTNTAVGQTENPSPVSSKSENVIWEWLWANATFSEEELIAKSGQGRYSFDQKWKKLVGNRILYPDGTVNSFVQRYLRERVLSLFSTRPKKRHNTAASQ